MQQTRLVATIWRVEEIIVSWNRLILGVAKWAAMRCPFGLLSCGERRKDGGKGREEKAAREGRSWAAMRSTRHKVGQMLGRKRVRTPGLGGVNES